MDQDFSGKTVIVTGAAKGLGRETATAFLARGASVLMVDSAGPRLEQTFGDIGGQGGRAEILVADVSDRDQCFAAVERAVAHFGRLDVLANVAGVLCRESFLRITEQEVERIFKVNVAGPLYLSQAAIPHLLKTHGNIVNVGSSGGVQGSAYLAPYTASKAALIQLTRSLAMEFIKSPIRINTVSPGPMVTEIGAGLSYAENFDPELLQRFQSIRPMEMASRWVAEAIVFVASERAAGIHGANLNADQGASAG